MLQKVSPLIKVKPETKHEIKSEECAVCLEDWLYDCEVRQLTCGHHFHKLCIDSWLLKH